jgi:crossover junction endodeoxyribonuclease RuvC
MTRKSIAYAPATSALPTDETASGLWPTPRLGLEGAEFQRIGLGILQRLGNCRRWPAEPRICRVDNGTPDRKNRLKALGNSLVPQIPELIGRAGMILGIDIGVTGGIAVLSASGDLIEVHAMPCLADGHAGRRVVNGPLLASIVFASHATRAFVEHVSARPGEGAVGAFAFGRSRGGVIEGVLAAAGVRCQFLTPPAWKRAVGLPPGRDKDVSRAAAIQRWPAKAELFSRKKDDGVAEAALIAIAGLIRERAP